MESKTCLITTPSDGNSSSSLGAGMLVAGRLLSQELQVAIPVTLQRDKASWVKGVSSDPPGLVRQRH